MSSESVRTFCGSQISSCEEVNCFFGGVKEQIICATAILDDPMCTNYFKFLKCYLFSLEPFLAISLGEKVISPKAFFQEKTIFFCATG